MQVVITLSPRDYDAVLFDLDGVLTRTASVHASAGKSSSTGSRAARHPVRQAARPFDIDADYRSTSTASRVTMAWQPSSSHVGLNAVGHTRRRPRCAKRPPLGNLKDRYSWNTLRSTASNPMKHRSRWCANLERWDQDCCRVLQQ